MEVQAWSFFSVWAFIGMTSFYLGFEALDKTDTISPIVVSFFKHFLAISILHSSSYALMFRPRLKIPPHKFYIWAAFAVLPLSFARTVGGIFEWYYPVYSLINLSFLLFYFLPRLDIYTREYNSSVICALFPLLYYITIGGIVLWYILMYMSNFMIIILSPKLTHLDGEKIGLAVHFVVESSFFFETGKTKIFPLLVLLVAYFTCVLWASVSGDERFQKWLPETAREHKIVLTLKRVMNTKGKLMEFAVGMMGTILFQSFFKLTSFDHVLAFLYFAVAWLANLALLMCFNDFGIFNFFLSNVIVGCTVSQFGLRGTNTWLAYGASVLLYSLRLKLESLCLVKKGGEEVEEVAVEEEEVAVEEVAVEEVVVEEEDDKSYYCVVWRHESRELSDYLCVLMTLGYVIFCLRWWGVL